MLKTVHNIIKVSVESRLEYIEKLDYLSRVFKDSILNISSDIENIEDKYYRELGQDITELNEEEFEYHSAEISKLEHSAIHFPQILFKSTIVSAHSIFESVMAKICKSVEIETGAKIKLKQLRTVGNEIENILNYYKLVHNLVFNELDQEIKTLRDYIKIRNCIVHQNADLNELDQSNKGALKKAVDNLQEVNIDENQIMKFSETFVLDYIAFVHKSGQRIFEIIKIQK